MAAVDDWFDIYLKVGIFTQANVPDDRGMQDTPGGPRSGFSREGLKDTLTAFRALRRDDDEDGEGTYDDV
ncbi:hypothetical protein AK812_SmicGene4293 [Symbiodinium microadriaticum]|uniref:Uncharacterized protein n=1 Tax=Symbiodinium microadriaticum TaxID=2951 RepID=A0A1Q9EWQ4_SYMMI|nr:hypothetical protein AK812_SmicGene4293 [Symbiodinium microadriaticum]